MLTNALVNLALWATGKLGAVTSTNVISQTLALEFQNVLTPLVLSNVHVLLVIEDKLTIARTSMSVTLQGLTLNVPLQLLAKIYQASFNACARLALLGVKARTSV